MVESEAETLGTSGGGGEAGAVAAPPPTTLGYAPQDPGVRRSRHSEAFQVRIWSAFILLICGAMLGIGMYMEPSATGFGTHSKSLGLPPCGFQKTTGMPCPTCGCTTAVTHLAHGHVIKAIETQPFGATVGIVAVILSGLSLVGLATGRWYGMTLTTISWHWRKSVLFFCILFFGGWAYKIYMMAHGW
jgi:hypothetical protein